MVIIQLVLKRNLITEIFKHFYHFLKLVNSIFNIILDNYLIATCVKAFVEYFQIHIEKSENSNTIKVIFSKFYL